MSLRAPARTSGSRPTVRLRPNPGCPMSGLTALTSLTTKGFPRMDASIHNSKTTSFYLQPSTTTVCVSSKSKARKPSGLVGILQQSRRFTFSESPRYYEGVLFQPRHCHLQRRRFTTWRFYAIHSARHFENTRPL